VGFFLSGDGVALRCKADSPEFGNAWEAIKLPAGVRERLLAQALLSLTIREKLSFEVAPLHGFLLLVGPPGTGKTTLARGLAYQVAKRVQNKKATFVQVDPHALSGADLGSSEKAVTKLFTQTLPEAAVSGLAIVLLDELETLAPDRTRVSLEANPVDVHRATNAVLAGMDQLTREHKNVLLIGTSNFPKVLDKAVLSRADLIEDIGMPNDEARRDIIADTLKATAKVWPQVEKLAHDIAALVKASDGLDGRAIRKAVFAAAASDIETAQNLNHLTRAQIAAAFKRMLDAQKAADK
jgi:AAA+ superfamily predicted ATPase